MTPDNAQHTAPEDDLDADAVLAELEADEDGDLSALRQQRIQAQLEAAKANGSTTNFHATGSASAKLDNHYVTLKSDDSTLQFTTEHTKAVVHFFHPDFARCSIMDQHLETIAAKHANFGSESAESEVKFARVDVQHAPFVVEKMAIRILPCVIGFSKGVVQGRVIGFEGLCWDGREKDQRVCKTLESTLVEWGVLSKALVGKGDDDIDDGSESEEERRRERNGGRRGITGRKQQVESDDDWD